MQPERHPGWFGINFMIKTQSTLSSPVCGFLQDVSWARQRPHWPTPEIQIILCKLPGLLTNCAIRTKTTKKSGAKYWLTQQFLQRKILAQGKLQLEFGQTGRNHKHINLNLRHSSLESHSSRRVSFMIPFQLSPKSKQCAEHFKCINTWFVLICIVYSGRTCSNPEESQEGHAKTPVFM